MRIFYKLITGFMIVTMLTVAITYIGLNSSEAIGDSYHLIEEETIFLVSLITLILSLVIGAAISISISRPMIRLKDAADEIRRGKLDTAVDIKSDDETGILADAFNKMVHDLVHEINEHKLTAANLREKNEFVKTVLESLPHPFYVIDAKDYTIRLANSAASAKGVVDGTTCYTLTHKTDKPCGTEGHTCPLEEVKRTGKPAKAEHLHYDKEGNVRNMEVHCYPVFDSEGNVVQAIESSLDITERKRAEESLQKAHTELEYRVEERTKELRAANETLLREITERKRAEEILTKLSSAVQQTADVVVITDRNGAIEYVNPAFEKITGYTKEETIGKTPKILKSGKHDKKFYEHLWKTILSGEVFHGILINKKNNGEIYHSEKTITPIKDANGNITHFVSTDKDITECKRADEIRLENERLEFADKAKSEFLASMSHELRTPLNSIIGFSELLKQKMAGDLNGKQEHYLDNVLTSGTFLLNLINDILDLSKVEAGKIELVIDKMSVPVTINETLTLIKEKAAKHNVLLNTEFDPALSFIEADKQRFKQVLFNLLSNAVKFSKEEGGIITITTKKEGDLAKISVSDTGIGIKEENLVKLFNKFEQLDSKISKEYGGTGLGLAITKKLVELHSGNIAVESRYGEGTTFAFTLPVIKATVVDGDGV